MLAGAFLLTGCPSQPTVDTEAPKAAYTTSERLIQQAEAEIAQARKQASPAREEQLMNAVDIYLQAEAYREAEAVLDQINTALLPIPQLGRYRLIYAKLALAEDRFFLARKMLTDDKLELRAGQLPDALKRAWYRQRADLFSLLGEEVRSVAEYQKLSTMLTDPADIAAVHEQLWQTLNRLPEQLLADTAASTVDKELRGWYQLALGLRTGNGDIQQQILQLDNWRASHPNHAAARIPPSSLRQAENAASTLPAQLALLLPESGNFAPAARTIRDGLMSALYNTLEKGAQTPRVRIYNTMGADIVSLYNQAVAEGAELVIGPLQKDHIEQLAMQLNLAVPTIALNYLESNRLESNRLENNSLAGDESEQNPLESDGPQNVIPLPANLYQFGLSITEEARQVADRAWIEGQRTALCIAPDTGWGQSARDAFEQAWLAKGGRLVEMSPFPINHQDFSPLLKPLLLLDRSEDRASRLERTLGKNLEFTPRRRQDLDMIFLVSYPDKGRQIKPTLDFLYAGDLPIYATSLIYTGTPNPTQDRDLENIRFSAMPWVLPGASANMLSPIKDLPAAYRNLFALGLDAYQLQQWLALMQSLPDTRLPGQTGTLYLGLRNQIQRVQPWGEFEYGRVKAAPQLSE